LNRWKRVLVWPFQFTDYTLFVFFLMLKLYLFGKLAGLVFVRSDMVQVTFGSVLLISFWTLWLSRYSRIVTLWVLGLILSFVIFSDLVYYRYFGDFITIPVIMQAGQAGAIGSSIVSLIESWDILFFLDLLIVIPIWIYLRKRNLKPSMGTAKLSIRLSLSVIIACIAFVSVYEPIEAFKKKNGENLFINNWWNVSIYNVTGLLGFHFFDSTRYIRDQITDSNKVSAADIEAAKAWFTDHQKKLASSTLLTGIAKDKNVLIVQAEAFQNFVIGRSVRGKEITPNLNRLIKESAYFENFHHQVGQGRTSDAEFLVNNSLYPLPIGSVYRLYPNNDYDSLPTILKANGYETSAFHGFEKSFWNRHLMYQNYELDHFYGPEDFAHGEKVGWTGTTLGDESFLDQTIDKLIAGNKPFYGFAITLSSHHPFGYIPQRHIELDVGELQGTLEGNYLHAIHYVDKAIGAAVERLKAEQLWDETVFVFYGDHDAALNLDAGMSTLIGIETDDLSQKVMKHEVPLIIHLPNGQQSGVYKQAVGMIDVAPTLLDLLGFPTDDKIYMGDHLFHKNGQPVSFRYGSFSTGNLFYHASVDGVFEKGVCYDLNTRKPTNIHACKPGFEESIRQLNISDNVIHNDLLKKLKNNQ
jgi:lipoteichoic acid synthase